MTALHYEAFWGRLLSLVPLLCGSQASAGFAVFLSRFPGSFCCLQLHGLLQSALVGVATPVLFHW
jgi:hypothetical protein